MDRSNSKANIKNKNLLFDDNQLSAIKRNLDKDDFNLINYLVDNEYSRLMDFEQELERVYKPYKIWGKKFRPNIQSRFRLLIDEIESEKHQTERIGELTNKLQNQYTRYHWKLPHDQIQEQLTEEELKKFGTCCTVELINQMVDLTKNYLKDKTINN